MSAVVAEQFYTPEEYLELERQAETRSEYFGGRIYAMSGVSREHGLISWNIAAALHTALRGSPYEAYFGEMRVKVEAGGLYTYPDVVVVCGERRFEDATVDTLLNATLLMEILSPSTEAYDRGDKLAFYRRLESLREYVLISQNRPRVEHYLRSGENWILSEVSDPAGVLQLHSLGCDLLLKEIYARVEFP